MSLIIRAQGKDSTHDVIKKFKKAVSMTDIVQDAKDGQYYSKPSKERATVKIQIKRLKRRSRSLKRMKNISPLVLQKIADRISK
ncbi:MAG: 30S ribosomal protein S21 [Patescibacteria group bacterium]|nr:30S ribosomal protein S21 [Patescibacteria group bacterium]